MEPSPWPRFFDIWSSFLQPAANAGDCSHVEPIGDFLRRYTFRMEPAGLNHLVLTTSIRISLRSFESTIIAIAVLPMLWSPSRRKVRHTATSAGIEGFRSSNQEHQLQRNRAEQAGEPATTNYLGPPDGSASLALTLIPSSRRQPNIAGSQPGIDLQLQQE